MAQQVRVSAALPEFLGSVPPLSWHWALSSDFCRLRHARGTHTQFTVMQAFTHTHKNMPKDKFSVISLSLI